MTATELIEDTARPAERAERDIHVRVGARPSTATGEISPALGLQNASDMQIASLTKALAPALLLIGLFSASCGRNGNYSACPLGTHRAGESTTCIADVDAGHAANDARPDAVDAQADGGDARPDGDAQPDAGDARPDGDSDGSCPPDHGELNCVHRFGDGGIVACGDVGEPSICQNGQRVCGPGAVPFATCTCTLCAPASGDGGQPDSTPPADAAADGG
ncbi:MAG: hypothetical protein JWM82_918 [Myxococcales bacterium]|nr:hypothetical protein [Myxococcales bacterium]